MSARQPKKLVAWRLTERCIELIQTMANERGVSQAAIVEMLVREKASQEEEERQQKLAA